VGKYEIGKVVVGLTMMNGQVTHAQGDFATEVSHD